MADIQSLLDQIPVQQIARQLGVDEAQAQQAISTLVPALVGGMNANAQDSAGAASLGRALDQHSGGLPSDLDSLDAADGRKIVHNIFGGQTDEVVSRLGGNTSGGSGLVQKLLPLLAPIVMAWLAKEMSQRINNPRPADESRPAPRQDSARRDDSGGGLTPVPEASRADSTPAPQRVPAPQDGDRGDVLTDILGQALRGGRGGGQQSPSAGGLIMDMLGGLLGGGKR